MQIFFFGGGEAERKETHLFLGVMAEWNETKILEAVKLRRGDAFFCGFEIEGRETHIVLSIGAEGIETHNFWGL